MEATLPNPIPSATGAPKPVRRPAPALWTAFAWTLIAALVGASVYGALPYLRDNGGGEPTMTAFQPGDATPEATADSGIVNYGGDPGRSWDLGDVAPLTGSPSILANLGESLQIVSQPLVVGDTVIVTTFDPSVRDGTAFRTIRYDLATQEVLWTARVAMFGPFATDGAYVYGLVTFSEDAEEAYEPGAIRLDSGELQTSLIGGTAEQASGAGPVVLDDNAFFANAYGDINVVDPGELPSLIFAPHPGGFIGMHPDGPGFRDRPPNTDMAMTEDWLFVLRPSKTIVKYDRRTGEELDSVNVVDALRGEAGDVHLQAIDDKLVVTVLHPRNAAEPGTTPASILVYFTDSLEPSIQGDVPDLRSNLVVTPDWIYLAGRLEAGGPVRIHRMHPVSGTFGEPISEFAAPETASLGLSLSGNTLMAVGPTNAYAFIDVESGAVIESGHVELAAEDVLTVFPMQLWGQVPVVVSSNGAIVTFGDDPSQP